jgi:hypothetical protein
MGLLADIRNRTRQREMLRAQHDVPNADDYREDEDLRDEDRCLEHRLREEVRRYEGDLRELAKT